MARWCKVAVKLGSDEAAATLVEYTLMMLFVAAACVAAVTTFGSAIASLFQRAVNGFPH